MEGACLITERVFIFITCICSFLFFVFTFYHSSTIQLAWMVHWIWPQLVVLSVLVQTQVLSCICPSAKIGQHPLSVPCAYQGQASFPQNKLASTADWSIRSWSLHHTRYSSGKSLELSDHSVAIEVNNVNTLLLLVVLYLFSKEILFPFPWKMIIGFTRVVPSAKSVGKECDLDCTLAFL